MPTERSRSPHIGILFVLLAAAFVAVVIFTVNKTLRERKISLEKAVQYVRSEYVFGRMAILSLGVGSTSFRLTLLTPEGEPALDQPFILPGKDIYIESRVLVIEHNGQERSYVFPTRLYSDTLPADSGRELASLYAKDGLPGNYRLRKNDPEWDVTVRTLYKAAFADDETARKDPDLASLPVKMRMDAALHKDPAGDLRAGAVFELSVHPNGGLELKEVRE